MATINGDDWTSTMLGDAFDPKRRIARLRALSPALVAGRCRGLHSFSAAVGSLQAVRAVGRTSGLNRIAIVIPCHRVINKDGSLCGYGGGLRRRQYLLDLERTSDEETGHAPR
jgi:O-6-methylguanine DNA methyltransferase